MSLGIGTVIGIAIAALIIVIFNEIGQSYYRNYCRSYYYKMAASRALKIDKPLIVIGDPHNGLGAKIHGPAYGSGNFIIDISGCSKKVCNDVMERDIVDSLKVFEDGSCVIFVSCVLEYVENIDEAIKEIKRVAGSSDNIFVVTVGTSSYVSYYYSYSNEGKHQDNSRRVFISAPPNGDFKYQDLSEKKKHISNPKSVNSSIVKPKTTKI
jgi:hypothetical protein